MYLMDTRVILIIVNNTGHAVTCTDIRCGAFSNLNVGDTLANGATGTYTSDTHDKSFVTWAMAPGPGAWEMGMICPQFSHNSAYGSAKAGLQHYSRTGTPATFTYHLGQDNQADWSSGNSYCPTNGLNYGGCSKS